MALFFVWVCSTLAQEVYDHPPLLFGAGSVHALFLLDGDLEPLTTYCSVVKQVLVADLLLALDALDHAPRTALDVVVLDDALAVLAEEVLIERDSAVLLIRLHEGAVVAAGAVVRDQADLLVLHGELLLRLLGERDLALLLLLERRGELALLQLAEEVDLSRLGLRHRLLVLLVGLDLERRLHLDVAEPGALVLEEARRERRAALLLLEGLRLEVREGLRRPAAVRSVLERPDEAARDEGAAADGAVHGVRVHELHGLGLLLVPLVVVGVAVAAAVAAVARGAVRGRR